jgi:hypothetical protein
MRMSANVHMLAMLMIVGTYGCQPTHDVVPGILGPIAVSYVADPVVDGDSVWGAYFPSERRIIVDRASAWRMRRGILAHERCHAALDDMSIELGDKEESVCSAIGASEVSR